MTRAFGLLREEGWAVGCPPVACSARLHDARLSDRQAVEAKCDELITQLEPAQATQLEREAITADTRRIALASDQELKRRDVLEPGEPMKVTEPDALVPGSPADEGRDVAVRRALGIDSGLSEASAKVAEVAERGRPDQSV
ncbi:MAG: hypothetical protein ACRDNZ_20435 [Streptosporangiaceae bacterium]